MRRTFLCMPLVLVTLLLGGGCALRVTDPAGVNHSLTYVDWSDCSDPTDGSTRSLQVLPGMRLTFHATSLGQHAQNRITPRLGKYEWIVPSGELVQEDYFFIGYLIAASGREDPLDDFVDLNDIARPLAEDRFHELIQEKLYRGITASMRWHPSTTSPSHQLCPTVAALRQAVGEPTKTDYTAPLSDQTQLKFLVDGRTFCYAGGATGYFVSDVPPVTPASPWYAANALGARVLVTLEIPIRLHSELRSHYVPVYTSFADVERELGVEVTGVRRSAKFFDAIAIEGLTRGFTRNSVIADDAYFTMWFGRWRGWARSETTRGLVAKFQKSEMLVAPGDVILTGERRRATDAPEVR